MPIKNYIEKGDHFISFLLLLLRNDQTMRKTETFLDRELNTQVKAHKDLTHTDANCDKFRLFEQRQLIVKLEDDDDETFKTSLNPVSGLRYMKETQS